MQTLHVHGCTSPPCLQSADGTSAAASAAFIGSAGGRHLQTASKTTSSTATGGEPAHIWSSLQLTPHSTSRWGVRGAGRGELGERSPQSRSCGSSGSSGSSSSFLTAEEPEPGSGALRAACQEGPPVNEPSGQKVPLFVQLIVYVKQHTHNPSL